MSPILELVTKFEESKERGSASRDKYEEPSQELKKLLLQMRLNGKLSECKTDICIFKEGENVSQVCVSETYRFEQVNTEKRYLEFSMSRRSHRSSSLVASETRRTKSERAISRHRKTERCPSASNQRTTNSDGRDKVEQALVFSRPPTEAPKSRSNERSIPRSAPSTNLVSDYLDEYPRQRPHSLPQSLQTEQRIHPEGNRTEKRNKKAHRHSDMTGCRLSRATRMKIAVLKAFAPRSYANWDCELRG